MAQEKHIYLRTERSVASHSCKRAPTMAEPASERAHALFSPPTIPLSQGADRGGGRRRMGGRENSAARHTLPRSEGGCIESTHQSVLGG
eukprot:6186713-Pleurochrysis_carterae.AAC.1